MEQNLSKISREDWEEWLMLPCTQEIIYRLQAEEEAVRTMLGAGTGIRERNVLVAGSMALELNARADALAHFRNKVKDYEEVVRNDRKEVNSEARKVVEENSEGEDVQDNHSWASPARQALRRKAAKYYDSDAGGDGSE